MGIKKPKQATRRFVPETTLAQARESLRKNLPKGVKCPCCGQFAKLYTRTITAQMALSLLLLCKETKRLRTCGKPLAIHLERFHHEHTDYRAGDATKLVLWGLLVQDENKAQYYRVTRLGFDFAKGKATVAQYANTYNNELYAVHGDQITIQDALQTRYDYQKVMAEAVIPKGDTFRHASKAYEIGGNE